MAIRSVALGCERSSNGLWSAREEVAAQESADELGTDLFNPRLAIEPAGTSFIVWFKRIFPRPTGPLRGEIVVRRRSPDGRWDPPRTLGLAFSDLVEPSLAVDGDGNAIVLCAISDGTEGTLWSARFERQQGWREAERIAIDANRRATHARLAVARDGRAVAVWGVADGNQNRIQVLRYDRAAGWRQAEDIARAGSDARMATVAAGGNGHFAAAWVERTGTNTALLWSCVFDGARWGEPECMPSSEPATVWFPEMAMDDQGNTLAIWTENTPALEGTLLSSYRAAGR